MFTAYSLSKLQTCLFLLSKNSKHPLSKDFFFFFGLSCLSLFFRHALRSPTNELNAEETWKRLDEARLFEQRGDDIVPYDYTHLYQQKQENGKLEALQLATAGSTASGLNSRGSLFLHEQLVSDDHCGKAASRSLPYLCSELAR